MFEVNRANHVTCTVYVFVKVDSSPPIRLHNPERNIFYNFISVMLSHVWFKNNTFIFISVYFGNDRLFKPKVARKFQFLHR
jgi:hypothetical protein